MLKSGKTRNIDAYRQLHQERPDYGKSSARLRETIVALIRSGTLVRAEWAPKTILDFGCGKSPVVDEIAADLDLTAYRYDPAIEEHATLPVTAADVVINTDVLEHLDQAEVDLLLADIAGLSPNAFFNVATAPARAVLPSGENAHATVQDPDWWQAKLSEHFERVTPVASRTNRATFVTWPVRQEELDDIQAALDARPTARWNRFVAKLTGKRD